MYSDLIVMTFDQPQKAKTVRDALQAMRKDELLGVEWAVTITRDQYGEVAQDQAGPNGEQDPGADAVCSFAILFFFQPLDQALEVLVSEAGLDETFVRELARSMEQHQSALLFLVRPDSVSDADELLRILNLFKGKIHQTTLPRQAEAYLSAGHPCP